MSEPERRGCTSTVEVRSQERRTIGGYAAVFGRRSHNLGGFVELVDSRAFDRSRADGFPGVVARFNHSDDLLLGTTRSGTCRVDVDDSGLVYEVDVPECRADVYELVSRGDVRASSFAFECAQDDWQAGDSGYPVRMLRDVRLIDVAPVTNPAYPDATVGLRSLARHMDAPFEDVMARAQRDELRSFFIRTDLPRRRSPRGGLSGSSPHAKVLEIQARRWPEDVSGRAKAKVLEIQGRRWPARVSAHAKVLEIQARRWPEGVA